MLPAQIGQEAPFCRDQVFISGGSAALCGRKHLKSSDQLLASGTLPNSYKAVGHPLGSRTAR